MIARARAAVGMALKFAELAATLRPGEAPGKYKVLAAPAFLGGPATKFAQLGATLAARSEPYSAVFCFSAVTAPIPLLRVLKTLGARIVVNQNGVYYPRWYPRGWEKKNAYLKALCEVADHVFFQSEFARESFEKWVGRAPSQSSLLYNPVDLERFHASGRQESSDVLRVMVFQDVSEFTREPWRLALELRERLKGKTLSGRQLEWRFMGRNHDSQVFKELGLSESEGFFNVGAKKVAAELRGADVAVHLIYNDVCPNKVLEALASGVAVIGLSAGGTKELVGDAGKILAVPAGYEAPVYPQVDELADALAECAADLPAYRAKASARAKKFDLVSWIESIEKEA